jgi:DNA repair protein RadC
MNAFIRDHEGAYQPAHPEQIINMAQQIISERLQRSEDIVATSPQDVQLYLQLQLGAKEQEIFGAMFLDTRHRLISFEKMFLGTIDGATVHPREVVKAALRLNAAAVIFSHNHPSGVAEPSQADIAITTRLKSALALIDVRVLDHIIVVPDDCVSLAQRGHL